MFDVLGFLGIQCLRGNFLLQTVMAQLLLDHRMEDNTALDTVVNLQVSK
jgi:hypothetical protein